MFLVGNKNTGLCLCMYFFIQLIFSLKSAIILALFVGMVLAKGGHGHGGGESGEHGLKNCTIVPSTTTNCTGVTGPNCTDSTALRVTIY